MTDAQHPARRLLEALQADEQDCCNHVDPGPLPEPPLESVVIDGYFNLEAVAAAIYPYQSGDHTIIGPECFTDAAAELICYKGENYGKLTHQFNTRADHANHITLHGGPLAGSHYVVDDKVVELRRLEVPAYGTPHRIATYEAQSKYAGAPGTCEVRAWTEWHYTGEWEL